VSSVGGDKPSGLDFDVWYGDWSSRILTRPGVEPGALTTTAHCDGEAANFLLETLGEPKGVSTVKRRELLERFVESRSETGTVRACGWTADAGTGHSAGRRSCRQAVSGAARIPDTRPGPVGMSSARNSAVRPWALS
jgi:hypothetical protein